MKKAFICFIGAALILFAGCSNTSSSGEVPATTPEEAGFNSIEFKGASVVKSNDDSLVVLSFAIGKKSSSDKVRFKIYDPERKQSIYYTNSSTSSTLNLKLTSYTYSDSPDTHYYFHLGVKYVFSFYIDSVRNAHVITIDTTLPENTSFSVLSGDTCLSASWTPEYGHNASYISIYNQETSTTTKPAVGLTDTSYTFTELDSANKYDISFYELISVETPDGVTSSAYTKETKISNCQLTTGQTYSADVTGSYSLTEGIWEISSDKNTVKLSNVANKKLFVIKTGIELAAENTTRYVKSVTGTLTAGRAVSPVLIDLLEGLESGSNTNIIPLEQEDYGHDLIFDEINRSTGSARTVMTDSNGKKYDEAGTPESYEVGAEKYIYYEQSNTKKEAEKATLRAKNSICYVWVVNNYYATSAQEGKITTAQAQALATVFSYIYNYETQVYGKESNQMWYKPSATSNASNLGNMTEYSPTGTMINIVLTDINKDTTNGSVIGYFTNADSFTKSLATKSNEGKYFYIDSYWWTNNNKKATSTLSHEFQHLIQYGRYVDGYYYTSPDSWFTEMSSMVCEDMLGKFLGTQKIVTDMRVPAFNSLYYEKGFDADWDSNNPAGYYGRSYVLGSYLARTYGGAAFVKKLIQRNRPSGTTEIDQIVETVNEVRKEKDSEAQDLDWYDILRDMSYALLNTSDTACPAGTLNKDADTSFTYNSYAYPMKAFSLYSYTHSVSVNGVTKAEYGPFLFSSTDSNQPAVQKNGIVLEQLIPDTGAVDTVQITLSSAKTGDSKIHYYIAALPVK